MKAFLLFIKWYNQDTMSWDVHPKGVILADSPEEVAKILRGELQCDEDGEYFILIPKDRFTIKHREEVYATIVEWLEYKVGPLELGIPYPSGEDYKDGLRLYFWELPWLSK
jgi:hypothetical protein